MNRIVLLAAALLTFAPAIAHSQAAPTYQGQDGQTKEAIGTFPVAGSPTTVVESPSSAAAQAITPTTALNSTGIVAKASAGNFYGATLLASTTAGFLVVANLSAVPASGTALTAAQVLFCVPATAGGTASAGSGVPDRASAGVVALFSTACATYTPVSPAAVHIRARAQ